MIRKLCIAPGVSAHHTLRQALALVVLVSLATDQGFTAGGEKSKVAGQVVGPTGKPVAQATVLLIGSSKVISLTSAGRDGLMEDIKRQRLRAATSDEQGRFSLEPISEPGFLIAAHDNGVGYLSAKDIGDVAKLQLKPWAAIRGVLRPASVASKMPSIGVCSPMVRSAEVSGPFFVRRSVKPDAEGRFTVSGLPAGDFEIGRRVEPAPKSYRDQQYADTAVKLKAGQTLEVVLQITGQPIVGRAVGKGPPVEVNWTEGDYTLERRVDPPPVPARPNRPDFRSEAEFEEAQTKRQEAVDAFFASEAGRAYQASRKTYPVQLDGDGNFRIEAVPPGKYNLDIRPARWVTKGRIAESHSLGTMLEKYGYGHKEVVVPEVSEGYSDKPLDAGVVEVELFRTLQVGDRAPDFQVKTLGGEPVRLSDYRGKFVLLDFWATWCGPCIAEMPRLKQVYEEFGKHERFVMIGLSLDTKPATAKTYCTNNGIGWTQAFAGPFGTAKVLEDYAVQSIPQTYLISPEGIVLSKRLSGSDVHKSVAAALR